MHSSWDSTHHNMLPEPQDVPPDNTPPSQTSHSTTTTSASEPNAQEARLRVLQNKLSISEDTFDKCRVLYDLRAEDFCPAMGMIILSLFNNRPQPPVVEPPAQPMPPKSMSAGAHTYSREFKAFLKAQLRTILLDPSIERYGRAPAGAKHTTKCPVVMMQKVLDEQTNGFRSEHLPAGYPQGDSQAITSVIKVIRAQLKADKTQFAKLLLGGIRSEPGTKVRPMTVVPSLYQLVAQVHRIMDIKYDRYDDKGVHQAIAGTAAPVRIAFLRLHLYQQHRAGAQEVNWEAIDAHLARIRTRSSNYRDTLAAITLEMDQRLWNGQTTADQMEHLDHEFPSDSDIEARAASLATNPVGAETQNH